MLYADVFSFLQQRNVKKPNKLMKILLKKKIQINSDPKQTQKFTNITMKVLKYLINAWMHLMKTTIHFL